MTALTDAERHILRDALAAAECSCGHPANWHTGLIGCNAEDWERPACDCRNDWLDAVVVAHDVVLGQILAARISTPDPGTVSAEAAWLVYRDQYMRENPWCDNRRAARQMRKREFIAGYLAALVATQQETPEVER